jgi:Family of unknown function (DUF6460)
MEHLFGGNPLVVFIKLAIICVVVGIVLNVLGVDPTDLLRGIPDILRAISQLGWGWVEWVFRFFVLGAIIVIPVWIIVRIVKFMSGDSGRASRS